MRPVLAGWPPLDLAAAASLARSLGRDQDLDDLLAKLKTIHAAAQAAAGRK